jgi:hypothetical protein
MAVAEPQVIRPEGIDDTVCQRCGREAVSHRLTVSPLDPTTEREDGPNYFVVQRLGDDCIRELAALWFP